MCGNLFHHAIEMFLKGYLASKKTLADLKDLGHRLGSLWGHFKQDTVDYALARFDQTVAELDAFESIRYPDRVLAYGMQSFISISQRHTTDASSQVQVVASGQQWSYQPPATQPRPEPIFQIVVKEIDELAWVIFENSSVNPKFFTNSLPAEAKGYLSKENEWAFV